MLPKQFQTSEGVWKVMLAKQVYSPYRTAVPRTAKSVACGAAIHMRGVESWYPRELVESS